MFVSSWQLYGTPTMIIPVNPGATAMLPIQAPPDVHRDLRRVLDPFLRLNVINEYETGMREIADELINGFSERGACEFVSEFAQRMPSIVLFRLLLGFPEDAIDEAYHWTLAISHSIDAADRSSVHSNFRALVDRLLEQRRREPERGDIVDALLTAHVAGRPVRKHVVVPGRMVNLVV